MREGVREGVREGGKRGGKEREEDVTTKLFASTRQCQGRPSRWSSMNYPRGSL